MSTWLGSTAISGIPFLECLWLRWVQGRFLIRIGAWMKSSGHFVAYTHVLCSVQPNTALSALWKDFFPLLIISSISWLYDNQKGDDPGRVSLKQFEVFHEPRGCKQQQSLQLIIPLSPGPSLLTVCLWTMSSNLCSAGSFLLLIFPPWLPFLWSLGSFNLAAQLQRQFQIWNPYRKTIHPIGSASVIEPCTTMIEPVQCSTLNLNRYNPQPSTLIIQLFTKSCQFSSSL